MHRPKQTCQCKLQCARKVITPTFGSKCGCDRNTLYKGKAGPSTASDLPVFDDSMIPPPEDLSPRPKSSQADHLTILGAKQGVFPRRRSNNPPNSHISIPGIDGDTVPPPPEAIFPRPPRRTRQSRPQKCRGHRHGCQHNHNETWDDSGADDAMEQTEEDGSPECTPGSHFVSGVATDDEDSVMTRVESICDLKVSVNESKVAVAVLRRDFEQRDHTLTEITRLQDQLQKHLEKALTEVTARVERLEVRATMSPGGVLSTIAESAAEDGTDSCDGYENTPRSSHLDGLVKESEQRVLQEVSRQLDNFRREVSIEVSASHEATLARMDTSMSASITDSTARLQASLAHLEAMTTAGISRLEEQANSLQADVEDTSSRVIRLENVERIERTSLPQVGSGSSMVASSATHPGGPQSGALSWSVSAPTPNGLGVLPQRRLLQGQMPQLQQLQLVHHSVGPSSGNISGSATPTAASTAAAAAAAAAVPAVSAVGHVLPQERLALEDLQRRLAGRVSGIVSVLNHQPRQEATPTSQVTQVEPRIVAARSHSRPLSLIAGGQR